jgi:hypothetical protein
MTEFGGCFRFVQLSVVTQILADLACTGRLHITQDDWTGDLVLRGGQIVAASLEAERGRSALESIAIGMTQADFSFVDEPVSVDDEPLIDEAERMAYMNALKDERQYLEKSIPTLSCIPKLVDRPLETMGGEAQITLGRATLKLIPVIASGQTLEAVARERGLASTLRDVAALLNGGLVRLELQEVSPVPDTPAIQGADYEQPADPASADLTHRPELLIPAPVKPQPANARALATTLRLAVVRLFLTDEPIG